MLPTDLATDVKFRLKNIKGQIELVMKMVNTEGDADKIINQFKTIDKAYQKTYFLILDEMYRRALAIKIVDTKQLSPVSTINGSKSEHILREFPKLEFNDLSGKLQEIIEVQKRIAEHNEEINLL